MTAQAPNFDLVIFGATGDLSMRKLLPCLYQAHAAGLLHPQGRILGASRSQMDSAAFRAKMEAEARPHIKEQFDAEAWQTFLDRIGYLSVDAAKPEQFQALADALRSQNDGRDIIFYLSTAPTFFSAICANLAAAGLNGANTRIVLEKPLGTDLESARQINRDVAAYFQEHQIYRIDHYLGKESLQNLLPLRFGNSLFEPIWNKDHIRSVEITVAEQLGVEERGEFYDATGALRDMMQNHIIQMLCFTAMEQPQSLDGNHIRDEKMRVLSALKPFSPEEAERCALRAQYTAANGRNGYLQENKIPADSRTETYVAIRAEIQTPRWQGVPFYLRTGKRLPERSAYIVLNLKPEAASLFGGAPNRIVISLQPEETVRVRLNVKQTGSGLNTLPADMVLDLAQQPGRRAEAYELLLREVIDGRPALFNRRDELEQAWAWFMPILENWASTPTPPHTYPAGSWGPQAARDLLAAEGNLWLEEQE